ncbi:HEAT repeat domain-containing protein [Sphingomonas sp. RT2P30]|uniref:HEAT repeat domain-containing protein n=1 Tax=Parasphingomonas halimpatiens TaxID=3096162 RepID=UPI002FC9CB5A
MSRSRDFNGLSLKQSVLLAQTTDSMAILDALLDHPHPRVRRAIVRNSHLSLQGLNRLAKDPDHETRFGLVRHGRALPAILEDMAKDADWRIRAAVAKSPRTPVSTLMALASDRTVEVRRAVARNLQTPESVVAGISGAEDPILAKMLERRQRGMFYEQMEGEILSLIERACEAEDETSVHVLVMTIEKHGASRFAGLFQSSDISPEVTRLYAAHDDARARRLIAGHRKLDPVTMASLARDGDVEVRCELASNIGIDATSMNILRKDSSKRVRERLSLNYAIPYDVRCGFSDKYRGRLAARDRAPDKPVSAEIQFLVTMAAIAASWLIYFAARWLWTIL